MSRPCVCGTVIPNAFDALGCIECGRAARTARC